MSKAVSALLGWQRSALRARTDYEGPTKEIPDLFAENEVGARDQRCSKVSIIASERGGWKYELIEKGEYANSVTLTSKGSKSLEPHSRPV
jgi:hypothetical protein